MGKPGATDWMGAAGHSPELGRAEAVLNELARGGKVSAEDLARTEGALWDSFWTAGPAESRRAESGLLQLGGHGTREDRLRLAGEAAAAGRRGSALFEALLRPEDNVLSPEEKKSVRAAMEESPEKTLQLLATLLEKSSGKGRSSPDGLAHHRESAVLRRRVPESEPRPRAAGDGNGDGHPEDLLDRSIPLGQRIALAGKLAAAAFPFLLRQLNNAERSEEAGLFLRVLGRNPLVRRTLYAELRRMDAGAGPELHARLEPIRRDIELHARPRGESSGEHVRPRDDPGETTLLERALDHCDARELLLLATGRETTAVRFTLIHLGVLRGAADPRSAARRQ
jgi:hypothetical protein